LASRLILRSRAEAEILEASAWYDEQQMGLGEEFAEAVERTIDHIGEAPFSFPRVNGDTRRAVLRRFPYSVYFRAETEEVIITAVMHNGRNPRLWQSRN